MFTPFIVMCCCVLILGAHKRAPYDYLDTTIAHSVAARFIAQ
jgi:hypothetical protein